MASSGSGEWLEIALIELCSKLEGGLHLDQDLISGLVSFCELAPPEDAKEYLNNIIGWEAGQSVIEEYLQRRGYSDNTNVTQSCTNSKLQEYVKPPSDRGLITTSKKQMKISKEEIPNKPKVVEPKNNNNSGNPSVSKKKKAGKVISLAEAAKGSIVFQQGKPCSCQARRHKLISNCLSCGKIVCEQEGEGPCSFCGVLVLREGSAYAGLENSTLPLSESEAVAEAFAKRLVDYDRNAAARTTVIDDQSDYYEIEGNSWLSAEEKELLQKQQQEIEEAERARRNKVVITFDLVGRKVLMNEKEASELESENRILRPLEERDTNRIKPNPSIRVQPVFVDPTPAKNQSKGKQSTIPVNGVCLEITGRVQHDGREIRDFLNDGIRQSPAVTSGSHSKGDNYECSLDYD